MEFPEIPKIRVVTDIHLHHKIKSKMMLKTYKKEKKRKGTNNYFRKLLSSIYYTSRT